VAAFALDSETFEWSARMRELSLEQLKDLIWDAYSVFEEEHDQQREAFSDISWVQPGFPYPLTHEDPICARISAEISDQEKSKRELLWRLKRISYPYPSTNKSRRTFYRHLQSLGVLDLLLNPPLLYEIRRTRFFLLTYAEERKLHSERKSPHGYPLPFHRQTLWELARHMKRISRIAESHRVPREWFRNYVAELRTQLLREASIYFPELLAWFQLGQFRRATRIRPRPMKREIQVELYRGIEVALSTRGIKNHTLARQLTALICSPVDSIQKHKLEPTPDAVRSSVRQSKK